MNNRMYYNDLFEIYKDLLTKNEIDTFKEYYQEDFSITEISENKGISRAAVQKTIKHVTDKLDLFENIIHKNEIINGLKETLSCDDKNDIKEKINELINM